jgi:hypothetical protein
MITEIFGHLANFLYTAGSSFKNQIYLRLSFVFAAMFEIYFAYFHIEGEPIWSIILWSIPLMLINLYYFIKIYKDRQQLYLTPEEEKIYYKCFSYIEKQFFKKILDKSKKIEFNKDIILVEENKQIEYFYLIVEGIASISVQDKFVTYVSDGIFIGEMSFLTNSIPKATVKAETKLSVLRWDKDEMLKYMEKDRDIENAIKVILSNDLVAKIERLNARD